MAIKVEGQVLCTSLDKVDKEVLDQNPEELLILSNWRDKIEIIKGSGNFHSNDREKKIKAKYENRYGR